jgi:hypothetical protein
VLLSEALRLVPDILYGTEALAILIPLQGTSRKQEVLLGCRPPFLSIRHTQ